MVGSEQGETGVFVSIKVQLWPVGTCESTEHGQVP